jgi:hypothetical protein
MRFFLTGINQGKTVRAGGFHFEDGVCQVADNEQAITSARNILGRFHEAFPEHELEMVDGNLVKRAPMEDLPVVVTEDSEQDPDPNDVTDSAGGFVPTGGKKPKGKGK